MIQPEFGDWRVPLDKPHEAEHLRTESPGVIRRMQVQAQNLMNTKPVYGAVDLSEWQPMTKGKRILRPTERKIPRLCRSAVLLELR